MADEPLSMPDPSGMDFSWTQADIDAARRNLAWAYANGTFNPATWEGDALTFEVAGAEREFVPKYLGYVFNAWKAAGGTVDLNPEDEPER